MLTPEAKARRLAATAAWRLKNPDKVKLATQTRDKAVLKAAKARWLAKAPALYKLRCSLAGLARISFKRKGWGKETKTQELLGCTFEEFAAHLQKQFKEGMTLENHGDWHIDHIKPCATATSAEELAALFHFTNLQPLWASENLSKGSTYYDQEARTCGTSRARSA